MKNSRVLEMLEQNRLEELIAELRDEIFTESLKTKPNAKKRYAAMKRYLKTISESRPILTKPCEVKFANKKYNSFTNTYTVVLTTETCGELEMCDDPDRYPDVTRLIHFDGNKSKIDICKVLAEAKSKGYKYTKTGIYKNDYLMKYNDAYFRMALVDITYSVLDNGEEITVFYKGEHQPLTISNDIGVGMIMPIRFTDDIGDVVIAEA